MNEMVIDMKELKKIGGKRVKTKEGTSVSLDIQVKKDFKKHCKDNKLQVSPTVQSLIVQMLRQAKKGKRKNV